MTLVTRGGQTLTAYGWDSLADAYAGAGLPADALVVVQGSHKGAGGSASASGSTHDAGDTADLRTRTLPDWACADLCRVLVVELRRRGWCAWFRDSAHGGMDPHIHAVYRWADPPLSSGARSQVVDYDAGRNGLANNGPDYHPRPPQAPYETLRTITRKDGRMIFKTHSDSKPDGQGVGGGRHYLVLPNGNACLLQSGYTADGLPVVTSATEQTDRAFLNAVGTVYNGDGK